MYRCKCENGYVRCYRMVPGRGDACDECYYHVPGDGTHNDGYHGTKPVVQSPFVRRALANNLPAKVLAY